MSKDGTQHRDRDGILKELYKICTKVCIKKQECRFYIVRIYNCRIWEFKKKNQLNQKNDSTVFEEKTVKMLKNEQRLFHLFMALKIKGSREKLKQVLMPL